MVFIVFPCFAALRTKNRTKLQSFYDICKYFLFFSQNTPPNTKKASFFKTKTAKMSYFSRDHHGGISGASRGQFDI